MRDNSSLHHWLASHPTSNTWHCAILGHHSAYQNQGVSELVFCLNGYFCCHGNSSGLFASIEKTYGDRERVSSEPISGPMPFSGSTDPCISLMSSSQQALIFGPAFLIKWLDTKDYLPMSPLDSFIIRHLPLNKSTAQQLFTLQDIPLLCNYCVQTCFFRTKIHINSIVPQQGSGFQNNPSMIEQN